MTGSMSELSKMTIVNVLLRAYYPARFLELSTPQTGHGFKQTRNELCARADLAKYRVPVTSQRPVGDADQADIEDGSPTSDDLVDTILGRLGNRPTYDVILCDPFHSYMDSLNDLRNAWRLLVPGGTLVVHDCNPATEQHASPLRNDGIWCGRTFEAFLDFVGRADLPYFTIDADHGIGVVRKDGNPCGGHPFDSLFKTTTPTGRAVWDGTSPEDDRFGVFDTNRAELLNLVTVEAFDAVWSYRRRSSSDVVAGSSEASKFLCVGGGQGTEWTRGRTQTEIIGRYEEMAGRCEAQRVAEARRISGLRDRIDQQQKLIEELKSSLALRGAEVDRCEESLTQAEQKLNGLRLDLLASREVIRLGQKDLEERAVQVVDLANLVFERTSDLTQLKSSSTFRLRALALRARLPLMLWRAGAATADRLRTVLSTDHPPSGL